MPLAHKKRLVTIFFFILTFCILVFFIYQGCRQLSIREAEANLTNFLLKHRAIHTFVAKVQRPEVFRLQDEGTLDSDYFSPTLFSRTFIARSIMEFLNEERRQAGLDTVAFRLAAKNPRNPSNAGDTFELELLQQFNAGTLQEYKQELSSDEGKMLYYALPVAANRPSCMRCHGNPKDAPAAMVALYGDQAGFFEEVGDIRALISVKVPLHGLLLRAQKTTLLLSGITFILLSLFLAAILSFFKKIDQQAAASETTGYYLDSILHSSKNTAIIGTDNQDMVVYANEESERLLEVPVATLLGKNLQQIHTFFNAQSTERFASKLETIKKVGTYRFSVNRSNRVLDVRISSITDKHGKYRGLLFIGHDITKQVTIEKDQEIMAKRLHKLEKMESIGLMASGVAHDLNNILAGITSYPELILLSLPEDSKLRRPLQLIEESGKQAAAVVDDLLTVARGAAIVKEVKNLNELIHEYLRSPEHGKLTYVSPGIDWQIIYDNNLKNVHCAPIHFKKCLMNLLRNGVEAMGGKGRCTLTTSSQTVDEAMSIQTGLTPGEYSVVSIQDTGPGIAQQDIDHIFEPFYTKKTMGVSGTGLGLAVVWSTMQDHNGTVTAHSTQGEGTRFDLYFPVSNDSMRIQQQTESIESLQGNNELILVVDDESKLLDIATQKLIALGYQVELVNSGEQAVAFLRDNDVDLVLLDMIMEPGISGYETFKQITTFKPDQKALIVSGYANSDAVEKLKKLGVSGFLKKPYTLIQLGTALQKGLQKE